MGLAVVNKLDNLYRYVGSIPTFQFKTRKLRQIEKDYKFVNHINARDMWTWKETQKCNVNINANKQNEYLYKRCQKTNSRAIISIK